MLIDTNKIYSLPDSFTTFEELIKSVKQRNLPLKSSKKDLFDVLVVLSQQVDENGVLSDLTMNRVKKGCTILEEGKADYMVMAGRDMHTGKNLPLAELMWKYAFELGSSKYDKDKRENIKANIEPNGTDTLMQLFCFVRDHVMEKKRGNLIVVTDDYQALGKAIPYCKFIVGNDLEACYSMSDTSLIFKNHEAQEEALEKQFSSLDLASKMFQGISSGVKNHKNMMERIFSEHDRYKGQNPLDYLVNLPI